MTMRYIEKKHHWFLKYLFMNSHQDSELKWSQLYNYDNDPDEHNNWIVKYEYEHWNSR